MKILKNFKDFAFKGNVLDMAVGVIVGGAFGKIVTSVVNDIMMPIIGIFMKQSFTSLVIPLRGSNAKLIGNYNHNVVDFLIIAVSVFLFIQLIGMFKKKEEPKPEPPKGPTTEELLAEIRDLLKENK